MSAVTRPFSIVRSIATTGCAQTYCRTSSFSTPLHILAKSRPSSSAYGSKSVVRAYHSHDYPLSPPFSQAESSILDAAVSHIPTQGFTASALHSGARDAGYLDVSVNLFPKDVFDLVNYYLVTQRHALKDTVQFPDTSTGVGSKVRILVLQRLRANEPIIHRWQEVRFAFDTFLHLCNFVGMCPPPNIDVFCYPGVTK